MPVAIALLSYATAACAFFLLSSLLLFKWKIRIEGLALLAGCVITAVWAGLTVYSIAQGTPITWQTRVLEILRNGAWTAFLAGLMQPQGPQRVLLGYRIDRQRLLYIVLYATLLTCLAISVLDAGHAAAVAGFVSGSFGLIVMAIMGMLLIEQLLRHASSKDRWSIKFACLGIGGIFAFDFYLYVDTLLFNRIQPEIWASRGFINSLAVPLIAISAARNPGWSIGIAVSRRVLFHSVTLIGSAVYLLAIAGAGYYLRFFGGEWGPILQTAFLSGAALLLISVLFSGSFRSWLKVTLSKHFYTYGYDYREEWLRFTQTLSGDGRGLGERAIEAIATLVESNQGVLVTRSSSGSCRLAAEWNTLLSDKADVGNDDQDNRSLCNFLATKHWVIDIAEYQADPSNYPTLTLPGWLAHFSQAWLIVPLKQDHELFGFVVLGQAKSKINLNWEVLDLLKVVGAQTASYLARQETADALATARQFETFNRMSTFVVHDLKNLVSQLALLTANAERYKDNPEFQQDMLETIDHAVQKMRTLLQKFNRESSIETLERTDLGLILTRIATSKKSLVPCPLLEVTSPGIMVSANAARLERVIGHLVQNAVEATPSDGRVSISLTEEAGHALIKVTDTGRGMSDEFIRTRLFQPFESTKVAGMGIGVFETKEYIQQIGGKLEVQSQASHGTTFKISLPLYDADDQKLYQAA